MDMGCRIIGVLHDAYDVYEELPIGKNELHYVTPLEEA